MDIKLMTALVNADVTFWKVKLSLDEIKLKNPHRVDLINSHESTLLDLKEVVEYLQNADRIISEYTRQNTDITIKYLELKRENAMLKTQVSNLTNNTEL